VDLRPRLGKFVLIVASAAATWIAVDVALLVVHGPVRVVEDFYEPEPRFGYRMRPGLDFVFASPYHGYAARVRTNARGLRDDEIAVPKPPGVFRILLLGDSMTAGLEVERGRTFEAICEERLRVRGPVEVVNAGVRGYNLDNIIGFFENEGVSFEPDVVVYVFCDNDLVSSGAFAPAGSDISRGFTLRGAAGRLAAYSHLAFRIAILRQRLAQRRERDRTTAATQATIPGGLATLFTYSRDDSLAIFEMTERRIRFLAELSAQHGAAFMLACVPQRVEVDPAAQSEWQRLDLGGRRPDFDGARRYLDAVARSMQVAHIDAVPAFRAAPPQDRDLWFHRDPHLNERGHALFGGLLADTIAQSPAFAAWSRGR
jgi:hypothetical protein